MTEKRFIYKIKNGTMVIIDKKDNVLIRDKYRACDYLNRLNEENEELKQIINDKETEWLRNNTVWEQMPTSKPTVTKTTLNDKND